MRRRAEHLHDGLRRDLEWRFVPFLLIVLSLSVFVPLFSSSPSWLFVLVFLEPVPRGTAAPWRTARRAPRPEVPHSRLPGVAADDGLDRVIVDLDLIGRQPVARELQRQQATGRDDRLLRLGVHPRQPGASPRPYWLGTSPYRVRARFRPLPAEDSPLLGLGSFLACRGPAGFPAGELTLLGFALGFVARCPALVRSSRGFPAVCR